MIQLLIVGDIDAGANIRLARNNAGGKPEFLTLANMLLRDS